MRVKREKKKPGTHKEGPCGTVPSMNCELPFFPLKETKGICQSNCVLGKGQYQTLGSITGLLFLASINP